jgi:hypothetical protein
MLIDKMANGYWLELEQKWIRLDEDEDDWMKITSN